MSSPGSGKTTVLAATLDELRDDIAVGVIEGDIATDLDAAKLAGRGAQVSLLNTSNGFGGECHLDAPMVNRALTGLDLPPWISSSSRTSETWCAQPNSTSASTPR